MSDDDFRGRSRFFVFATTGVCSVDGGADSTDDFLGRPRGRFGALASMVLSDIGSDLLSGLVFLGRPLGRFDASGLVVLGVSLCSPFS